jgi:hypothetical protein
MALVSLSSASSAGKDVWESTFKRAATSQNKRSNIAGFETPKKQNFQLAMAEQLRAQKDLDDINTRVESAIGKFEETSQENFLDLMKSVDIPQDTVDKFLRRVASSGEVTKGIVRNAKGSVDTMFERHDKAKDTENQHLGSLADWFAAVAKKYNPEGMMGVPETRLNRSNDPVAAFEENDPVTLTLEDLEDHAMEMKSSLNKHSREGMVVKDKYIEISKGFQSALVSSRKIYASRIRALEAEAVALKQNEEDMAKHVKDEAKKADEARAGILEEGVILRKKNAELEQELKAAKKVILQRQAVGAKSPAPNLNAKKTAVSPKLHAKEDKEALQLMHEVRTLKAELESSTTELKTAKTAIKDLETAASAHASQLESADQAAKIEERKSKETIAGLEQELQRETLERERQEELLKTAMGTENLTPKVKQEQFDAEAATEAKEIDRAFEDLGTVSTAESDNPKMQASIMKAFGNEYTMLLDKAQGFVADRRHFAADASFDQVVACVSRLKAPLVKHFEKNQKMVLELAERTELNEALEDTVNEQKERIKGLEEEKEKSVSLSLHEKVVGKLDKQLQDLQEKLELGDKQKTNLIDQMNVVTAKSKQDMSKCLEDLSSFRALIEKKDAEILQLKDSIEKKAATIRETTDKASDKVVDTAKLGKAASDARRAVSEAEAKTSKLLLIIKNLQNELFKLKKSRKDEVDVAAIMKEDPPSPQGDTTDVQIELENQRDNCLEALEVAKAEVDTLTAERVGYLEGLSKLQSMVFAVEKKWNEARAQNTMQSIAFAELQRETFATRVQCAWFTKEYRKKMTEVKAGAKEIERLVQSEKMQQADDSADRLKEAESKLEKLEEQFSTTYDAAAKKEALVMSLQRQHHDLSTDIMAKNEIITSLRQDIFALQNASAVTTESGNVGDPVVTPSEDGEFGAMFAMETGGGGDQSANMPEENPADNGGLHDLFAVETGDVGDQSANVPEEGPSSTAMTPEEDLSKTTASLEHVAENKRSSTAVVQATKESAHILSEKINAFVEVQCGQIKADLKSARGEIDVCTSKTLLFKRIKKPVLLYLPLIPHIFFHSGCIHK